MRAFGAPKGLQRRLGRMSRLSGIGRGRKATFVVRTHHKSSSYAYCWRRL